MSNLAVATRQRSSPPPSLPGGASPAAIRAHYDVSNEFYRLWLDPTLAYSCALFDEGAATAFEQPLVYGSMPDDQDSLERAQQRKFAYMLDACHAAGARRLLDIGCGWGGLLRHALDHYSVRHATGLTLSDAQALHLNGLANPRIAVHVESWADHRAEPYDAITSTGAMEHFCRPGLTPAERIAIYRDFFRACHQLLAPGGSLSLQTICKGGVPLDGPGLEDMLFIFCNIFPDSDVPRLSELVTAAGKLFEIATLRNDRLHYARTCVEWLAALRRNRGPAVELVGEAKVAQYERYLSSSARQFELNNVGLLRFSLRRI